MRGGAEKDGSGWKLPVNPMPPDTSPEDAAWATPRRRPQPIKTFEQKLRLASKEAPPPRAYIYAKRNGPGDVFRQFEPLMSRALAESLPSNPGRAPPNFASAIELNLASKHIMAGHRVLPSL